MQLIDRLKKRTGETDEALLYDLLDSAKAAIQARRYPFGNAPAELESRYEDLQLRCAMDLYNKIGAEGQTGHDENGVNRQYESSWISSQLLSEVVPKCGVSG